MAVKQTQAARHGDAMPSKKLFLVSNNPRATKITKKAIQEALDAR